MNSLIRIAAVVLALSSIEARAQTALPECNADETRAVFASVVNTWELLEFKTINNDDPKKRWCYAYFVGKIGLRSPYMEAIFTLEWLNESERRFWLQVQSLGGSCRGVMGNSSSTERCGR
jgi:hypothetical protein